MRETSPTTFNPIAALLAIAFPGAGHFYLGERDRAVYACAGILGLFAGGILLGGIDVIDSREDRVWFFGQACVGPLAFGVDYYHQNHIKVREYDAAGRPLRDPKGRHIVRTARPNEGRDPKTGAPIPNGFPPNRKSVTKMNELGTLAATLAGMINVIVIIDAAFPTRRRKAGAS